MKLNLFQSLVAVNPTLTVEEMQKKGISWIDFEEQEVLESNYAEELVEEIKQKKW